MLRFLGWLDIFTGFILVLMNIINIPLSLLIVGASYCIIKGVVFWGDFLSVVDLIVGIYIVFVMFGIFHSFAMLMGSYLIIKGGLSLV